MAINTGYLTSDRKNDELYTPFYAVDPIVKYLPKDKTVWLPFDEEWSAYYQTLNGMDIPVIHSSLHDGYDFFSYEPERWDIIVSNPPFSMKDKVIARLYELGKPFAVLLPLNSLQGKKRFEYFKNGIQLLSFDSRICFHTPDNMKQTQKGSPFASAYFCKDILPRDLIVEELRTYDKPLV